MPKYQEQFASLPAPTLRRLFRLVDQGLSYQAVADQLGCHKQAVYYRIRKRSGKAPRNSHARISEADRRRIRKLWQRGDSKSSIARQVGCSRTTVARYVSHVDVDLQRNPNYAPRPGLRFQLPADVEAHALKLLSQGKSYRQTALLAGCSEPTVAKLARSHEVGKRPAVHDGLPPSVRKQLEDLVTSGCTYAEVARRLSCHENTVRKYAKEFAGPRRRFLSEGEKILIARRAAEGATYVAIAQELGIHWKTVSRCASKLPGSNAPALRRRNLTRSQIVEVRQLSEAGESASAIAAQVGCSPSAVWYQQRLRLAETERERVQIGRAALKARRCPDCRAVCSMPCEACRARKTKRLLGKGGPINV